MVMAWAMEGNEELTVEEREGSVASRWRQAQRAYSGAGRRSAAARNDAAERRRVLRCGKVLDGGDGGSGTERCAMEEEDDEVTPGPLFISRVRLRRALTAHYRAVIGKARDRVRVSARLRGWWPHDRPRREPQSGNR